MNFYTYCRVGKKEDEEISTNEVNNNKIEKEISNSYQLCKINSKRRN